MEQKIDMGIMAEEPKEILSMHPKKFALWLFIVSIVMIFAAMSSAYIVRKGDGNWQEFDLPHILWTSSLVLVVSSITMQWAYFSAKKDNLGSLKAAISITLLLGVVFVGMQWMGWQDLQERRILLTGNPSGSFLYVLTGLHAFHLVTGIVFLLIMWVASLRDQIHSKALIRLEMCTTYWHFLDILWIYLFVFLLFA